MTELPKFPCIRGNRVEEHDGDVRFESRSGNMAVLCMDIASGHNYSSYIVDLAVGLGADTTFHRTYF